MASFQVSVRKRGCAKLQNETIQTTVKGTTASVKPKPATSPNVETSLSHDFCVLKWQHNALDRKKINYQVRNATAVQVA